MLIPYTAPAAPISFTQEIKKSIFTATLVPVESAEEAEQQLAEIKKKYKDATHNCSAYRAGIERVYEKSSDDGEPAGTAGHPMLHVLSAQGLTNTLAVVTRWFGGIKLGAGGLSRAYSSSVAEAVKKGPLVVYTPYLVTTADLPYSAVGGFENYVKDKAIRVKDRTFGADAVFTFLSLPAETPAHLRFLTDLTAGKAAFTEDGEEYVKIPR